MDNCPVDYENIRFLYRTLDDQNRKYVDDMVQATNYMITIIVGLWALVGGLFTFSPEIGSQLNNQMLQLAMFIVVSHISIFILIFWRLYALTMVNNIINTWPRMVFYEHLLLAGSGSPASSGPTLLDTVTRDLALWQKKVRHSALDWDRRFRVFCFLVENKRSPSHNQEIYNEMTWKLLYLIFVAQLGFIAVNIMTRSDSGILPVYILGIFVVLVVFFLVRRFFQEKINQVRQNDPTEEDIDRALASAG